MAKRKSNKGNRPHRPNPAVGGHGGGRGGAIWLYGVHAVTAALANPGRPRHRLIATEDGAKRLAVAGDAPEILERRAFEALLPAGAVHQGIALRTEPLPPAAIEDVADAAAAAERAAVVVLDQVSDPRNVGAVVRSAAVFGALGVVIPDRHSPPTGAVLAKSASGGLETVPLVRVPNLARALDELKEAGFWCVGLDAECETALDGAALPERVAFVLGAEGAGLRRLTREKCDLHAAIPGTGALPSLNVSAAATVALYEFARPR